MVVGSSNGGSGGREEQRIVIQMHIGSGVIAVVSPAKSSIVPTVPRAQYNLPSKQQKRRCKCHPYHHVACQCAHSNLKWPVCNDDVCKQGHEDKVGAHAEWD